MNVDCFSSIPDARINEVRNATKNDKSLQSVLSFILNGWPDSKDGASPEAKPFYDMRDTLSHSEGILLKGEVIVIPCNLRGDMKKRLHSAHLGYDSMMRRARGVIFWPGMAQEIKQLVDCCQPCQELRPRNQRETLKQHYDGKQPWEKIATDLFEIKGHSYLVTIDYYSNFMEVDYVSSTTSAQVIALIKKQCARYGIPKCIVSDPGPQFTSKEFRLFTSELGIMSCHHQATIVRLVRLKQR